MKLDERSGRGPTWLSGLRFRFACSHLLARLDLLGQLGGPFGLLPGSPLRLQLCFALGWFVSRGQRVQDRHRSRSRHCWGNCETRRTYEKRQLITCSEILAADRDVKEFLLQAEDNLNSTLLFVTSLKAGEAL